MVVMAWHVRVRVRMRVMRSDARAFSFLYGRRKPCESAFIALPSVEDGIVRHASFILGRRHAQMLDQLRLFSCSALTLCLRASMRASCSNLFLPIGAYRHQWSRVWSWLWPTQTLLPRYATRCGITCKAGQAGCVLAMESPLRCRRGLGGLNALWSDGELAVTDLADHLRWLAV